MNTSAPQEPTLDLAWARAQFPALDGSWAFLDNAGGTQILGSAVARISEHLLHRNVQTGGSYAVSVKAAESLQAGREAMQTLLNARRPEEIVFAPSSTVACQNLVRAMASQFSAGDEVIVSVTDHESNIGPWTLLEARGVTLRFWAPNADTLELDLEDLGALMNARTKLVAVTQASNILGTVNAIGAIARFVHERGALICVDAVACAPHRAIDVQALDVDYLFFSIYKVFGPHFACLYGRYELLAELDGLYHYFYGKDRVPMKLEPGNASYELAYGASAIPEYLAELGSRCGGEGSVRMRIETAFAAITRHECAIGERLLAFLRDRDDVRIIGRARGDDVDRVPTIAFKVRGRDSGEIARAMDAHGVAIRFGDFHATRLIEHLGLQDGGGVVRVSMTHYNSPEEVDALIAGLAAELA
ncbi:MAG TPA: cysteine desulfurase-like protein [Pseudomonadales bacterium]|nr:cysteine desulfurase-like protein [Pseudomonadales bacterium]